MHGNTKTKKVNVSEDGNTFLISEAGSSQFVYFGLDVDLLVDLVAKDYFLSLSNHCPSSIVTLKYLNVLHSLVLTIYAFPDSHFGEWHQLFLNLLPYQTFCSKKSSLLKEGLNYGANSLINVFLAATTLDFFKIHSL